MTPREFIVQWIDALRSGNYQQGHNQLVKRGKYEKHWKFCCLGVGCDIAEEADIVKKVKRSSFSYSEMGFFDPGRELDTANYSFTSMPYLLTKWLGWDELGLPFKKIPGALTDISYIEPTLMKLNDAEEFSFEKIADFIERWILPLYDKKTGEPIRTKTTLRLPIEEV
jgi:hypothetical protein